MTYEQAFKDWETLWSIGPAEDMTGAYVDQEDLDRLLRSPNKRTAAHCLERQIDYWFEKGPSVNATRRHISPRQAVLENPHIEEIAIRHGYGYLLDQEKSDDKAS